MVRVDLRDGPRVGRMCAPPVGVQSLSPPMEDEKRRGGPRTKRIYEPPPFASTVHLILILALPISLPLPLPLPAPRRHFGRHSLPSPPSTNTMIAVQKPPSMFSSPMLRPTHSRNPSAPVVVRPSHTPGVLNIAKAANPSPRPQHVQAQPRSSRASPKAKQQQRSPQPQPAQPASVEKPKASTTSPAKADQPSPAVDKAARGRKQNKQPKDRRRADSVSPSDAAARRHNHQPSPPPARIPTPPSKASAAPRAEVPRAKPDVSTSLTDPFADNTAASVQKGDQKSFASPPKLASQPSGKLARRRQATSQVTESPTPKVPSRRKEKTTRGPRHAPLQPASAPSTRPPVRRASTDMTMSRMDSFPVCDDSSDFGDDSDSTPPTTPIREVASVPHKQGTRGTWQQEAFFFEEAPRTAPLASTFGFPFVGQTPCSTPTPAQRRRNHRRVPSEGVFAMSTDEESPSSSTTDLSAAMPAQHRTPVSIPRQRCYTDPYGNGSAASLAGSVPDRQTSSSAPATGYFAGSVFQNSPSPDEIPAPSFAV
ncbi:hypothetical protein PYCCODRAFT_1296900 [Trametes coccinea BRFM310]|uniref:Uncharacterized protein n=1 Tax=Trametes coccinea (strain BRFM310) TaxID=1353009 RepID=A0A1Y2IVL9_TRAC3|nr:hypothetical protein PYCCODRAFT_1296900 [Trametes coccinea BRFM310]